MPAAPMTQTRTRPRTRASVSEAHQSVTGAQRLLTSNAFELWSHRLSAEPSGSTSRESLTARGLADRLHIEGVSSDSTTLVHWLMVYREQYGERNARWTRTDFAKLNGVGGRRVRGSPSSLNVHSLFSRVQKIVLPLLGHLGTDPDRVWCPDTIVISSKRIRHNTGDGQKVVL